MSHNQSRFEKSEAQYRKSGRSGSSGQQRSFSGGGGRGGGGTAPPPSYSSTHSSLSGNRSFKKSGNNAQGGQSMGSTASANSESNASAKSSVQNGAHTQPPLHGMSDAPASGVPSKPTDSATSRSTRPVPKAPASQSAAPTTPANGDSSSAFPLQFGSFSPGFVNGMQIPARTSSAPPNLDEQKRDQARHDSLKAAPTLPIPAAPKQQQSRKDVVAVNQTNSEHSHPPSQAKRDVHAQIPLGPTTPATQKSSVLPVTGMPMPFQQPQVSVQFGAPNAQIQSQAPTTLQMPMQLPVGNVTQAQQQVFVPSLQSHSLQPQGMMHQGQSLSFTPQMGQQLSPQLQNLGIGIAPQFAQQQGGKFVGPRKTVKITHPETHEELSFDRRADSYVDGGSSGSRSHPNVPPQSQSIPSFTPPHQINYYSPIQAGSYNHPSIYFPGQTSLPLTSNQMTAGSPAARYNYPGSQGPQSVSLMNLSSLNPLSTKVGPAVHGATEMSLSEHGNDAHAVVSSAPPTSVQVTLKPSSGSIVEKVGSSPVSIASHVVSEGESSKLVRPPGQASSHIAQKESAVVGDSFVQRSGSISLPAMTKHFATASDASVQRPATPSTSSVLPEELVSTTSNTEGQRRESVRRSNSINENQKKPSKKDQRYSQLQNQADATESAGCVKSSSLKISSEVAKHPDMMQSPPSEVVGSSTSILSLPSQNLEHSNSSKDEKSETVEGNAASASSETSGSASEFIQEPVSVVNAGSTDSSEVLTDNFRIGEVSTCDPSSTSVGGTVSDNLDTAHNAKQDGYDVREQWKSELSEEPQQGIINVEMSAGSAFSGYAEGSKQFKEEDSKEKETTVGKESGSVKTELELNEDLGSISEINRTNDYIVKSSTTSSDSVAAETISPGILSHKVSHEDNVSSMDASIGRSESIDNQEQAITEPGASHQEEVTCPTTVLSEVNWKVEGRSTGNTNGGLVSTSLLAPKDKNLESNRANVTAARVKKKRKEILKNADAAGATSDLYNAYKGPEEKQETAVCQGSTDRSSSADVKQVPVVDTEKSVIANEEDGQSKAEPDDWEDAADVSTPKLKTSDNGKRVRCVLINPDEDGNEIMGKKKYSRDFLLTFKEQCTDLPAGFEIGSDIADTLMSGPVSRCHIVDRDSYPHGGRIIDRPGGGSRADRRGSGMADDDKWSKSPGSFPSGRDIRLEISHGGAAGGFRPGQGGIHGVLRNPRGPPSPQYAGGILSGPLHSVAPQGGIQRNNSDAGRWQRATGIQKGLIPSPQTPLQMMHKAEKKYVVGTTSDEEQRKQRQLKAILNKLTPQNFDKLFEQVKEVNIDNAVTLSGVISQIFDKALMEPTFCEMYARFCSHLAGALPDFIEDNRKITFKILLLNKCQEEFERGEREQAEANRDEEEGEVKMSEGEREEKKIQARRRMLGNIRLIGELYKKKMLTERIMHECIKKLLGFDSQYQNTDEEDVEALCKLMSTIGKMIDHPKAKEHMDAYFDMMKKLSNNMELSSRVRFMLKDAIDLRKNKWQQRRKVEGPKKIEEVHRDAAQERQAQASRLARGPGINSSGRRGQPMDSGIRGSTMLSPNSQMGGFRGMPSPSRGFGAQDVRFEDRRTHERTLSVPLPQRPLDDDSITLGPQGGLARGMSIRGQPLVSSLSTVPMGDVSPNTGDSRRMTAGPNGHNSVSEWTSYNSRVDLMPRYATERLMGVPSYDQSNSKEQNSYFGNRDLRSADSSFDRSMGNSPATHVQGSSVAQNASSEKVWPEERLREMSISAIREYYSAKDEKEVALCIKDLNSPSFHPSMISIWVTDSFERKDMDRDSLARLLVNLTKSLDSSLNQTQLLKGFESVLATLEDAVTDAPKAAEFLGRILAKVIVENVVPLKEIGRLIHEGGEEPGHLLQIGLAAEVISSILESIRLEKGECFLNEIRTSSNLQLEDFRPPDAVGSRRPDAFI